MSMQEVRSLMSADYRKYVADIIEAHPIQERNRAHYESFETKAQLASMTRNVRLKIGKIAKGTVVFYVVESDRPDSVTVWWQGCMCPAVIKRSSVKPLCAA